MQMDDPEDPRFEQALDVLRDEGLMSFRDLMRVLRGEDDLTVRVQSSWFEPSQIDERRMAADLARVKRNVEALCEASPRSAALVLSSHR
jgi:hypothetical protein